MHTHQHHLSDSTTAPHEIASHPMGKAKDPEKWASQTSHCKSTVLVDCIQRTSWRNLLCDASMHHTGMKGCIWCRWTVFIPLSCPKNDSAAA